VTFARGLHHTYAEYLEVEARSDVRHEYLDGEIYAMAGGTPEHAILAGRVGALLSAQLERECRLASSDMKVAIVATGLTTYPDLSIVCGPLERDPRDPNAVTNPLLLVEITSPSTQDYDRGDKLEHYRRIASLQVVLIVSHAEPRVTVVRRDGEAWSTTEHRAGDVVALEHPSVSLSVSEIYAVLDGL